MSGAVLVVEDDRELREVVRRYLERVGYAVHTTGSGAEALSLLEVGGVGLVVLDLGLPDVDGLEVLAAARQGREVPVVVLTARSQVEDRIAGLRRGADDYVTKPFSPTELVLRVQAVLHRTRVPAGCPRRPLSVADGCGVLDHAAQMVWPGRGIGPGMNGMHAAATVADGGQTVGSVRLGFTTTATAGWAVAWSWVLGAAAVALLAALVTAGYVTRRLTRPLQALTGAARRLAAGDPGARAATGGPGELGELATAFDTVSAASSAGGGTTITIRLPLARTVGAGR